VTERTYINDFSLGCSVSVACPAPSPATRTIVPLRCHTLSHRCPLFALYNLSVQFHQSEQQNPDEPASLAQGQDIPAKRKRRIKRIFPGERQASLRVLVLLSVVGQRVRRCVLTKRAALPAGINWCVEKGDSAALLRLN